MDPKIYFEKRRGRLDTCLGKQPYLCSSPCTIITSGPVIVKILKLARFRRPEMPGVPSTMSGKSKAQAEYSEINVVSDGHVISCFSPRLILRAAKIRRKLLWAVAPVTNGCNAHLPPASVCSASVWSSARDVIVSHCSPIGPKPDAPGVVVTWIHPGPKSRSVTSGFGTCSSGRTHLSGTDWH